MLTHGSRTSQVQTIITLLCVSAVSQMVRGKVLVRRRSVAWPGSRTLAGMLTVLWLAIVVPVNGSASCNPGYWDPAPPALTIRIGQMLMELIARHT